MSDHGSCASIGPRTYRWADRVTKLAGVVLVAIGLEIGGHTTTGIGLGIAGAVLAVCTVFIEPTSSSDEVSTDE